MRKHLSPALVVATAALFIAMSSTAVAVGVVPLARRALVADNAAKLQGKKVVDIAALPGPSTSAAGLITVKRATFVLGGGDRLQTVSLTCDGGKVLGGGFSTDGYVTELQTDISGDGATYSSVLRNRWVSPVVVDGYAVCLR